MKVAEVVVRILEDEGIRVAFGIPGAAINPVYGFMKDSKIKHYVARHEEGAVHAADGHYRASGKLALAICTSGPGATNFVTGLYTALADSIPLIAITGNANSTQFGQEPFQCVDIAEICRSPRRPGASPTRQMRRRSCAKHSVPLAAVVPDRC
jgi:tartronate-semialdehyde synthase